MNKTASIFLILLIYIVVQGIAIWISKGDPVVVKKGIVQKVEEGEIPTPIENPEKAEASLEIFGMILFMTLIMLLLIKINLRFLIKALTYFVMLFGLMFTFWNILDFLGLPISLLLFSIYMIKRNAIASNFMLLFVIPGIGSWLGSSLALIPSLILLLGLSIYDIISVFLTKHMVTLAEGVKSFTTQPDTKGSEHIDLRKVRVEVPLMFSIPFENRVLGLGTGDLAIPVTFTISVLKEFSLLAAVLTAIGGMFGLLSLLIYLGKKENVVLPALPPIALGLLLGFFSSFISQNL